MGLDKRQPYRNPKILAFAKDQPCVLCGATGTTVAAHYSGKYATSLGKGMGQKTDDHCVAYLCAMHHAEFDTYSTGNDDERAIRFMLAIFKTQRRWLEKLLPTGVTRTVTARISMPFP